jgi:hypothetical protein
MVRNPMNFHQVSKITLSPDVVDCIVFWTKNPAPMMSRLDELRDYHYYFQFTLNSYGKNIEPKVPSKNDELIGTFQRLSDKIGAEKVIWRYDPIFLSRDYGVEYHITYFEKLAKRLEGYTHKCTVSFIDIYRNTQSNFKALSLVTLTTDDKRQLAKGLSEIALSYGMAMDTCAEDIDLEDLNISHGRCIDDRLIEKITGCRLNVKKDKGQRLECGCVESIDIGAYNSCLNFCKYCYANYILKAVEANNKKHNPKSPLILGGLSEEDKIIERAVKSYRDTQINLLERI